ncbi:hypothetical protein UU9_07646 [Rhodanobacter fulvus Jip2]|uniref:Uncharacterized protein n=1 Tax=Rhodanobacter fulvus Jip2 TaxID=1163408 RepID=I4VS81_9GAMM|nr:hypothetical protein UU9_07646 [Rhodanobacter fulvus Jip2]
MRRRERRQRLAVVRIKCEFGRVIQTIEMTGTSEARGFSHPKLRWDRPTIRAIHEMI